MRRLSRHVGITVLFSILTVLLVVVSLDVMSAIIDGVGDIKGDFSFAEVVVYVLTTLPGRLYQNIPFAALIGCLIGLGSLASNSELVVMRASGVSLLRIVSFVLKPVIAFIVVGVLLGEFAVPYTDQLAEGRKALLQGRQDNMASASGLWNREGQEFVHVNVILPNGQLYGVFRYRFDDQREVEQVSFAERASYHDSYWQESDVVTTRFEDDRAVTEQTSSRRWYSGLSPDLLRLVLMEPESLPIIDLFHYANYLQDQGQSAGKHWLAFWGKLLQPLTTVGLVLIAVSFVFGPLREATMGFRIFAGVVVGIVFSTSQQMLGPASLVYGFSPLWAVLVPIVVSVFIGVLLLRRAA